MVLNLPSSANSFTVPVQWLPVDLLPNRKHRPFLFVSTILFLPLFVSLLPLFVISLSLLASLVLPPIFFSLLPSPLFLLSASSVVVPFPPRALPLLLVFVLRAPAHIFHY